MPKTPPDPRLSAHNWRKRAEQMRAIAHAVESGSVRERLMQKVCELLARAEEAERAAKNTPASSPDSDPTGK